MTPDVIYENFEQLFQAIENCLERKLFLPTLILVYSGIDSASWLACTDENKPVNERFKHWVEEWIIGNNLLQCTSEELYAARCGILHTLTPDSNLSKKKGVKTLTYAWGTAEKNMLEEAINLIEEDDKKTAIHINDIVHAFKASFKFFWDSALTDKEKTNIIIRRAGKYFINMSKEVMESILQSHEIKKV